MNASAIQRLRELPEVFSISVLAARLGGDKNRAAIYAKRWRDSGLLAAAGPRVGVYFNLVRRPDAASTLTLDALQMIFPEAVLSGETVLHDAGWTTQIPRLTQVVVLDRKSLPEVYGFEIHRRPASWFWAFQHEIRRETFPRLSPEGALTDLWGSHGRKGVALWRPDIDDLEEDEINWSVVKQVFDDQKLAWPDNYPAIEPTESAARTRPK